MCHVAQPTSPYHSDIINMDRPNSGHVDVGVLCSPVMSVGGMVEFSGNDDQDKGVFEIFLQDTKQQLLLLIPCLPKQTTELQV